MNDVKQSAQLTFCFETSKQTVDAAALGKALLDLSNLTAGATTYISPKHKANINVKTTYPGSFVVDLELGLSLFELAQKVISYSQPTAQYIIGVLIQVMTIIKHLQGQPPKEVKRSGNMVSLENCNNCTVQISQDAFHIYENPQLRDKAYGVLQSVNNDASIDAIKIHSDKHSFRATREEIQDSLPTPPPDPDTPETLTRASLKIRRWSFDSNLTYDFYYNNRSIKAKVTDTAFLEKKPTVSEDDVLIVDLLTFWRLNPETRQKEAYAYEVAKVLEHLQSSEADKKLPEME